MYFPINITVSKEVNVIFFWSQLIIHSPLGGYLVLRMLTIEFANQPAQVLTICLIACYRKKEPTLLWTRSTQAPSGLDSSIWRESRATSLVINPFFRFKKILTLADYLTLVFRACTLRDSSHWLRVQCPQFIINEGLCCNSETYQWGWNGGMY
jgi:hypothetical protein